MEVKEQNINVDPKKLKELIPDQMIIIERQKKKSLCKIEFKTGDFANGFLCKIPGIQNPVLITNNHVLNEARIEPGKEIKIYFTGENFEKIRKTIKIDRTRATYTIGKLDGKEIDTTIIELRPDIDELKDREFLEMDEDLLDLSGEDVKNIYKEKNVYVITYSGGINLTQSIGYIHNIFKETKDNFYTICHKCITDFGSSGSPVILYNHKVIGVHRGYINSEDNNRATLLQYPIKKYVEKLNLNNEGIVMTYEINSENSIKVLGERFVNKNKGKCNFIINNKKYDICEYIDCDKYGININDNFLRINLIIIKEQRITDLNSMFLDCSSLAALAFYSFNTEEVEDMMFMFKGCVALRSIYFISFKTDKVKNMNGMFQQCGALTSLNLRRFNTQNVTDMAFMFGGDWLGGAGGGCSSLTTLDLSSFNTQNVVNMAYMFGGYNGGGCSSLKTLDLSTFNTANVSDMSSMFCGCSSMTSLNLSSFNTKKVSDMGFIFCDCSSLTTLNLSSFNTQNVTNMYGMFKGCSSFTSLDLSKFNTQRVTDMESMFNGCSSLTTINFSSFNLKKGINISHIFDGCKKLKKEITDAFNSLKK